MTPDQPRDPISELSAEAGRVERPTLIAARALLIAFAASLLGLGANALSARPVPLLDANGPGARPEEAPRISLAEFSAALDANKAVMLIDVRSTDDFARGHPAAAVNAPALEFVRHYPKLGLAAADIVVLMCQSADCSAADHVAKILASFGHRNVRVLQGGWEAFRVSKLEVTGSRE